MSSTEPVMSRPVGVTISAVVALIGSAITLLFAGLATVGTIISPPAPEVPRLFIFGAVLGMVALGGLGVATAIGLFRLREWARISILVFGGLTAALCLMSVMVLAVLPLPMPTGSQVTASMLRKVLIGIYAVPILLGVWWLVQFNRASVKQAFANTGSGVPSRRPLSISIIGWWLLVGGMLTVIPTIVAMPAFIAGFIFTGISARLVYAVFAAVFVYLGWGLLKLQERARMLTIWWLGLSMAHVTYVAISPGARGRMQELQAMYQADFGSPSSGAPDVTSMAEFTIGVMVMSALIMAVGVWFLVHDKGAFSVRPASERLGDSQPT